MSGYYDLVLGIIPVALLGITGVMTLSGFAVTTAVPVASTFAIGVMGHAMFVNGPGRGTVESVESAASDGSDSGVSPPPAD